MTIELRDLGIVTGIGFGLLTFQTTVILWSVNRVENSLRELLKSQIKGLEDLMDSKIKRLEDLINSKINGLENLFKSEIKRLEDKIETRILK